MASILKEFKEFAVKGNVVDMAVGIIIGAAFSKIVSSLVANVIMPPLGLLIGGIDFSGLKLTLKEGSSPETQVTLDYGVFAQTVVDFLIVAFAIFLIVKAMNSLRKAHEPPTPSPQIPAQEALLAEIRDILKAQGRSTA